MAISAPEKDKLFTVDGYQLSIQDIAYTARSPQHVVVELSSDSRERMDASRALKQRLIDTGQPIYGVTTGFGDSCIRQIAPAKTSDLQRNMFRYHMNGTGPLVPDEVVRATLLIRANCLARGNSGVRPAIAQRVLDYLNHDVLPLIPERGSVGASGDLVPLSYVAAAVFGEGSVRHRGTTRPATDTLGDLGLTRLEPEAKDALALLNGTSFSSAFASLAVADASRVCALGELCTALAAEALRGNRGHFSEFLQVHKPHPGQAASARNIASLLRGSRLALDHDQVIQLTGELGARGYLELARPIQDRYSVRCAPNVIGVLRDTAHWASQWIEVEVNSSNDNPLFDTDAGAVYSGGNFFGGHVVQAMDSLKTAVANVTDLLDRQLELVIDEKFNNGLTPNLIPRYPDGSWEEGLHHGFKGMQLACSAITAEALKTSGPAGIFSRSTEAHNQDKVSMAPIAARDARQVIALAEEVIAIHLLALCQAIDLRGPESMAAGTRACYELIRSHVPHVAADRSMQDDIATVIELIRSDQVPTEVSTAVPTEVSTAVTTGPGAGRSPH
ncbi:MAG: aromatic amino acid lyase [Nocardiopsaceae bacterium]|nr:aromatic amino acid lyase [Nocardiopsaceae bacterium]